jgi:hypothetical protein
MNQEDIRARNAQWEPRCQYIKANEMTAKGYGPYGGGHPWPMTVAQAEAHGHLCGGLERNHPAKFVGTHWDHDEFIYDPAQDSDPRATIRFLLNELDGRS